MAIFERVQRGERVDDATDVKMPAAPAATTTGARRKNGSSARNPAGKDRQHRMTNSTWRMPS
jgi:hypothetical protein